MYGLIFHNESFKEFPKYLLYYDIIKTFKWYYDGIFDIR